MFREEGLVRNLIAYNRMERNKLPEYSKTFDRENNWVSLDKSHAILQHYLSEGRVPDVYDKEDDLLVTLVDFLNGVDNGYDDELELYDEEDE